MVEKKHVAPATHVMHTYSRLASHPGAVGSAWNELKMLEPTGCHHKPMTRRWESKGLERKAFNLASLIYPIIALYYFKSPTHFTCL